MRPRFGFAALAALTVACGGGGSPTSPSLSNLPGFPTSITMLTRGNVRATVDGVQRESTTPLAAIGSSAGTTPLLTLSAGFPGSDPSQFQFESLAVTGPLALGTHTSGSAAFVTFSLSNLSSDASRRWTTTPFTQGSSGSLTITTATATRVAGTFSFTAVASTPDLTPATRTVTNGTFDVSQ